MVTPKQSIVFSICLEHIVNSCYTKWNNFHFVFLISKCRFIFWYWYKKLLSLFEYLFPWKKFFFHCNKIWQWNISVQTFSLFEVCLDPYHFYAIKDGRLQRHLFGRDKDEYFYNRIKNKQNISNIWMYFHHMILFLLMTWKENHKEEFILLTFFCKTFTKILKENNK